MTAGNSNNNKHHSSSSQHHQQHASITKWRASGMNGPAGPSNHRSKATNERSDAEDDEDEDEDGDGEEDGCDGMLCLSHAVCKHVEGVARCVCRWDCSEEEKRDARVSLVTENPI
jgi:hypothetical protein